MVVPGVKVDSSTGFVLRFILHGQVHLIGTVNDDLLANFDPSIRLYDSGLLVFQQHADRRAVEMTIVMDEHEGFGSFLDHGIDGKHYLVVKLVGRNQDATTLTRPKPVWISTI